MPFQAISFNNNNNNNNNNNIIILLLITTAFFLQSSFAFMSYQRHTISFIQQHFKKLSATTPTTRTTRNNINNKQRIHSTSSRSSRAMSSFSSSPQDDLNDNMEKWQKMYNDNAPYKQFDTSSTTQILQTSTSEIRVVTFDLDNTIWKTGNVISSANDALAEYLNQNDIHAPVRVEKIMGQLFGQNKGKYSPLLAQEAMDEHNELQKQQQQQQQQQQLNDNTDDNDVVIDVSLPSFDNIKSPVLLTQLRIDALVEVFNNQTSSYNADEIQSMAEEAFDIWTKARHDAIPLNLAHSGVIDTLKEIKSIQTSYGQNIVVGAITDGNSDPQRVDILKEYFDFCINAESVGISKPDRRVYDAAMTFVYNDPDLQHVFHDIKHDNNDGGSIDCDILFDKMQDKWTHVGDDFMKDIVGAKELKMRSIWSRELVKGKEQPIPTTSPNSKVPKESNSNEKNTQSKLEKDLDEKKVVKMIIGTDDFLMNEIHSEFADAIVDEFREVSKVLNDWHTEGLKYIELKDQERKIDNLAVTIPQEVKDLFEVVLPDEQETKNVEEIDSSANAVVETKFCIMCGTKLPSEAKFCSSCGSKQPELL